LDSRKPNNPIKKLETELNKEFSTEESRRAEKLLTGIEFNCMLGRVVAKTDATSDSRDMNSRKIT
jgi:organic hydroperoxide reductase OsmC/OhrA